MHGGRVIVRQRGVRLEIVVSVVLILRRKLRSPLRVAGLFERVPLGFGSFVVDDERGRVAKRGDAQIRQAFRKKRFRHAGLNKRVRFYRFYASGNVNAR